MVELSRRVSRRAHLCLCAHGGIGALCQTHFDAFKRFLTHRRSLIKIKWEADTMYLYNTISSGSVDSNLVGLCLRCIPHLSIDMAA